MTDERVSHWTAHFVSRDALEHDSVANAQGVETDEEKLEWQQAVRAVLSRIAAGEFGEDDISVSIAKNDAGEIVTIVTRVTVTTHTSS